MIISSGIAIIEEATDYFPKRDTEITARLRELVDFWVHGSMVLWFYGSMVLWYEAGVDVPLLPNVRSLLPQYKYLAAKAGRQYLT